MMEDRVMAVEQKFFCDRTTEKTVTLTVTDNQNTPLTLTNTTQRLSCQYPLSAVKVKSKSLNLWLCFIKSGINLIGSL